MNPAIRPSTIQLIMLMTHVSLANQQSMLGSRLQSRSDTRRARCFSEGVLVATAALHPSAKQASTFGCRLGSLLTDLTQPALEGRSVARGLRSQDSCDLTQRVDRLGLDLCRLAVGQFRLQSVM